MNNFKKHVPHSAGQQLSKDSKINILSDFSCHDNAEHHMGSQYIFNVFKGDELAETLARWAKCLAVFRLPLRSEFKFRRGRLCLSSFRGRLNKYQLRTGVDIIDLIRLSVLVCPLCV
ncbi:Hypothetical predicted protein [Octopus vulgaris]|uniref:Uncharacterized protein n=1 Tax=Octopus vulgaris TaxID=6645 RepID=A0AA36AXA1_OCTVU|nr:Hypothetical predicted protein [Octopus vulgaris]